MAKKVTYNINTRRRRPYGCGAFILDVILALITGGLWLIWIFVREMRNR